MFASDYVVERCPAVPRNQSPRFMWRSTVVYWSVAFSMSAFGSMLHFVKSLIL